MASVVRGLRPTKKARKTIAFDGNAGLGAVGKVTVFGITGRVHVVAIRFVCTENLVGASATISAGVGSPGGAQVDAIAPVTTATDLDAGDVWIDNSPAEVGYADLPTAMIDFILTQDLDYDVLVQNITDGTIIADVEYLPLTDNGLLTGD